MSASVLISVRVKASPERAFDIFTRDVGLWWTPDPLFAITPRGDGKLAFEDQARLITRLPDGKVFEIGRVTLWSPGRRLAFTWRQATFAPEQTTRVDVLFEPVDEATRVTVTHYGWTEIPRGHVARHGFPDAITQQRAGEWWRRSLESMVAVAARTLAD
jgi:uncharacterized protein YndB with AHSA1/START domain